MAQPSDSLTAYERAHTSQDGPVVTAWGGQVIEKPDGMHRHMKPAITLDTFIDGDSLDLTWPVTADGEPGATIGHKGAVLTFEVWPSWLKRFVRIRVRTQEFTEGGPT